MGALKTPSSRSRYSSTSQIEAGLMLLTVTRAFQPDPGENPGDQREAGKALEI